jgi:hypothetical protein
VRVAEDPPAHQDDMLFERAHLGKPTARPQHLGEVEHREKRVGMLLSPDAAQFVDAFPALGEGWSVAHPITLPPNALPDKPLM